MLIGSQKTSGTDRVHEFAAVSFGPAILRIRERLARWLIELGESLGECAVEPATSTTQTAPPLPNINRRRPTVTSEIEVELSHHAIKRYGERTGRPLSRKLQIEEISRIWEHAQLSPDPPAWLKADKSAHGTTMYASIADMVFPLVPVAGCSARFIATTVLVPTGAKAIARGAGYTRQYARSGKKKKQRKGRGPRWQ